MKKIILAMVLVFGSLSAGQLYAQVRININIGAQPNWGPVGYDYVDYYYLPEYGAYYDVPHRQFVYLRGNQWIFGASLPSAFGRVDLFRTNKIVINSPKPYLRHNYYRNRYDRNQGYRPQPQMVIRDRRDDGRDRYDEGRQRHDEGRDRGRDHDNGRRNNGRGNRD